MSSSIQKLCLLFITDILNKNTEVRDGALWTGESGGKYPLVSMGVEGKELTIFATDILSKAVWSGFL